MIQAFATPMSARLPLLRTPSALDDRSLQLGCVLQALDDAFVADPLGRGVAQTIQGLVLGSNLGGQQCVGWRLRGRKGVQTQQRGVGGLQGCCPQGHKVISLDAAGGVDAHGEEQGTHAAGGDERANLQAAAAAEAEQWQHEQVDQGEKLTQSGT